MSITLDEVKKRIELLEMGLPIYAKKLSSREIIDRNEKEIAAHQYDLIQTELFHLQQLKRRLSRTADIGGMNIAKVREEAKAKRHNQRLLLTKRFE